jgi:hypothetical protein
MKEKLKAFFDSKIVWTGIGTIAGLFGEKAVQVVNVIGSLVMAAL